MRLVESDYPEALLLPEQSPDPEKPEKKAETRLRDGKSGRALFAELLKADKKRANRRALTKAMVDGAKPFPEDSSGMCNLNFQDGKAIMQQSGVPFYAIFNGVTNYAEITPSFQPEHPDHSLWGDRIASRFHDMLRRWDGFDWNMQQASYWMRLHGVGPCYRDRKGDWRFRALETGAVLVPDGSASCVDDRLPLVAIRVPYRVHELWGFIKDKEAAETAGWKVESVKRAIRKGCEGQSWLEAGDSWEAYESFFNNNDILPSITGKFVHCVHLLVREFNGKISRFVITEDELDLDHKDNRDGRKDDDYLLCDIGCYENYKDALVVFFKDIGDGTWHSVKGYASDSFDTLVVVNQLDCQTIDAARMDMTVLLEFATTAQRDKFDKFQIKRGITKLPVGAKVVQARLQGMMQGALMVSQKLLTKLNNNIGNFQGRGMSREDGKGETVTATEVQARVAKEASLDQGDMTLFYGHLDDVYQPMFDLAADPDTTDEEAKRFQRECEDDGVPKEALKNCEVRASRESGYGSPAMRELKLQQLREIAPSLPVDGQKNLLDMIISAVAGPDKVALLNPRQHEPDLNDWGAAMENGSMEDGIMPPLISGQDDAIHLNSHLEYAAEKLEPLKDAMDAGQNDSTALEAAYRYMQILAEHCGQHLQRLFADPTRAGEAKMFKDSLAQIGSFTGKLRGAIIAAQKEAQLAAQEEQQATALSALDAAKVQSVQTQDQIAAMKAATQMRDKQMKAQNDMRIKNVLAAASIQRERAKTAAQPQMKAA